MPHRETYYPPTQIQLKKECPYIPFTPHQVLDSLSVGGGTNLNGVSLVEHCGVLVGLTICWRLVHYLVLKRSMF